MTALPVNEGPSLRPNGMFPSESFVNGFSRPVPNLVFTFRHGQAREQLILVASIPFLDHLTRSVSARTRSQCWFAIPQQARDQLGFPRKRGGDDLAVEAVGPAPLDAARITDNDDGTYAFSYRPVMPGWYSLRIR